MKKVINKKFSYMNVKVSISADKKPETGKSFNANALFEDEKTLTLSQQPPKEKHYNTPVYRGEHIFVSLKRDGTFKITGSFAWEPELAEVLAEEILQGAEMARRYAKFYEQIEEGGEAA